MFFSFVVKLLALVPAISQHEPHIIKKFSRTFGCFDPYTPGFATAFPDSAKRVKRPDECAEICHAAGAPFFGICSTGADLGLPIDCRCGDVDRPQSLLQDTGEQCEVCTRVDADWAIPCGTCGERISVYEITMDDTLSSGGRVSSALMVDGGRPEFTDRRSSPRLSSSVMNGGLFEQLPQWNPDPAPDLMMNGGLFEQPNTLPLSFGPGGPPPGFFPPPGSGGAGVPAAQCVNTALIRTAVNKIMIQFNELTRLLRRLRALVERAQNQFQPPFAPNVYNTWNQSPSPSFYR